MLFIRAMLLAFILLPLALVAGERIESETMISSAKRNGTNCTALLSVDFRGGGLLRDLTYYGSITNIPTQTATVSRISYDSVVTTLVTTIISEGTNVFVAFPGTETPFRRYDILSVRGATNVAFRIRPTFIAYE